MRQVIRLQWNLDRLVNMIILMLLSKFDCITVIEGNRGLGKSTLAYQIAKLVSYRMGQIGKQVGLKTGDYHFTPMNDLLYTRDEVLEFFNKWRSIGVADEMINVSFVRDFWQENQKKLIKMINMNRDHFNLFLACVPRFQTLDSQIKNLTKIRISIVRRGVAIIQTPNKTIYSSDIWDMKYNEGLERKWLLSRTKRPNYKELSTYRGYMLFKKLTDSQETLYQRIKNEKRNMIYMQDEELKKKKENSPFNVLYKRFLDGGIKNKEVLEGYAISMGMTVDSLYMKIRKQLKDEGKNPKISDYFWSGLNKEFKGNIKANKIKNVIESID